MELPDRRSDDLIGRLKRRAETGSTLKQRRRSGLFEMMLDRRAEFERLIAGRTWQGFTDDLTAEGVVNADGGPLTAERVRKTWWLVNKRAGAKTRKPAKAAARKAVESGGVAPVPTQAEQPSSYVAPPPRQFQRSKLKD